MKTIVGIDIGGSTTKISGFVGNDLLKCIQVEASNPIASLFGAFGQFLTENELDLSDIAEIHLTGVGSSGVTKPIYGIPTYKVDEFVANGVGGRYFAKEEKSVVVSMGTGTSYVLVEGDKLTHLGGIAIGGGTILGLSKLLLNTQDVDAIQALSSQGDYKQIDLLIGDISKQPLPGLNLNVTAANFGKVEEMVAADLDGKELKIAMNGKYLLDALKALTDETVVLSFNTSVSPFTLENVEEGGSQYLILPVRTGA